MVPMSMMMERVADEVTWCQQILVFWFLELMFVSHGPSVNDDGEGR